jgi:hypothetical protein
MVEGWTGVLQKEASAHASPCSWREMCVLGIVVVEEKFGSRDDGETYRWQGSLGKEESKKKRWSWPGSNTRPAEIKEREQPTTN